MMSEYKARVVWRRGVNEAFTDQRYSRRHRLAFDGGVELAGSSSPHSVPLPYSDPAAVDPEEMFVAALASCHMLWFLSLAAGAGFTVDSYRDDAVGTMQRNAAGRVAVTHVMLRPRVAFGGDRIPTPAEHEHLHHRAHAECFIANSVTSDVRCEPEFAAAPADDDS
jgi:organic hydroperoxide reductase OsmC/OhrA